MTASQMAPEWERKAMSPGIGPGKGRKVMSIGRWVSSRPMQFGPEDADVVLVGDLQTSLLQLPALLAHLTETARTDDGGPDPAPAALLQRLGYRLRRE